MQHVVLSGLPGVQLTHPVIAALLEQTLIQNDGSRYSLQAWAVMPDHVHVAATFSPDFAMGSEIRAWKGVVTRRWQTRTGSQARLFARDYHDRYARTLDQADQLRFYIEANPTTAGLTQRAEDWRWSSAWHRVRGRVFDRTWLPSFLPPSNR